MSNDIRRRSALGLTAAGAVGMLAPVFGGDGDAVAAERCAGGALHREVEKRTRRWLADNGLDADGMLDKLTCPYCREGLRPIDGRGSNG